MFAGNDERFNNNDSQNGKKKNDRSENKRENQIRQAWLRAVNIIGGIETKC